MPVIGIFSLPLSALQAIQTVPVLPEAGYCPTGASFMKLLWRTFASRGVGSLDYNASELFISLVSAYLAGTLVSVIADLLVLFKALSNFSAPSVDAMIACERLKARPDTFQWILDSSVKQGPLESLHCQRYRLFRLGLWFRVSSIVVISPVLLIAVLHPRINPYGFTTGGVFQYLLTVALAAWSLKDVGGNDGQFRVGLYSDEQVSSS